MQPLRTHSLSITAALLGLLSPAWAQTSGLRALVPQGCYSSSETFVKFDTYDFQSDGHCQEQCVKLGKPVIGLTAGHTCYCGDLLPVAANKVDDSKCDFPCIGFPDHMCGGDETWTVYLSGTKPRVAHAEPSSTVSSSTTNASGGSPTASAMVSTTVSPDETQTITAGGPSATSSASGDGAGSGTSTATKAGIAAGVAAGISLAAIGIGIFLFVRMRRRRAAEADYQRKAEIDKFVTGGKPGSASSLADSRLEPSVMMHRRESDGSIADNQDYSRRILKVTNPDGR